MEVDRGCVIFGFGFTEARQVRTFLTSHILKDCMPEGASTLFSLFLTWLESPSVLSCKQGRNTNQASMEDSLSARCSALLPCVVGVTIAFVLVEETAILGSCQELESRFQDKQTSNYHQCWMVPCVGRIMYREVWSARDCQNCSSELDTRLDTTVNFCTARDPASFPASHSCIFIVTNSSKMSKCLILTKAVYANNLQQCRRDILRKGAFSNMCSSNNFSG